MNRNLIPINLENRFYRGQLFKSTILAKEKSFLPSDVKLKTVFIKESIKYFLESLGDKEGLSDYEEAIIKKIIEDKQNLFINQAKFPGIYRMMALLSSLNFYLNGSFTLITTPAKNEALKIKKYLNRFRIIESFSYEDIEKGIDYTTNILVCDLRYLIEEIFNKRKENFSKWLEMVGLIIIHDVTSFSSSELLHLSQFLNVLRLYLKGKKEKSPLFLFTGDKIQNPEIFIKNFYPYLTIETLSPDLSYPECTVYYWIPPHIFDTEKREIKREDFYQEVKNLVEMLKESQDILFIHGFGKITIDKLRTLFGEKLYAKKMIASLKEVEEEDFYSYDYIILLGMPRDVKYTLDVIPHLLKPDGRKVIFIVLASEPISFYFLKCDKGIENFEYYPDILLLDPSPNLKIKYLREYINFASKFIYSYPEWESILKELGLDKSRENYLSWLSESEGKIHIENLPAEDLPFGCVESPHDIIKIKFPGDIYSYVDRNLIPEKLFSDSLILKDGIIYEIKEEGNNWEALPLTNIVERIPILELNEINGSEILEESEILNIKMRLYKDLEIIVKFLGYKELTDYNRPFIIIQKPEKIYKKNLSSGVILELPDNKLSHSFVHLLRTLLSLKYRNYEEILKILHKDNRILIYSPYNIFDFRKFFSQLRTLISNELPYFSKDLLLDLCPCQSGCHFCVDILECNEKEKDFNKEEIIKFFMMIEPTLNNELYLLKLELKYKGIEDKENAYKVYIKIRDRILKVFEEKLLIRKNWIPLITKTPEEIREIVGREALGIYTGKEVIITTNATERDIYWIIAHEYGHQITLQSDHFIHSTLMDKSKIPFEGNLFSEGAAEYLAFRASDHFIERDYPHGIEIPRFFRFDEYGEGFEILCWLENRVGLFGVLKFLKEGRIEIDGEEYGPEKIIKDSGLEERIRQKLGEVKG